MPGNKRVYSLVVYLLLCGTGTLYAQQSKMKKASGKIESGFKKNNTDTLASGYFDLGENFYAKGDLAKSEYYFQKSKQLYDAAGDAEGLARSSRALAQVQEDLNKTNEAAANYNTALNNSIKTGDRPATAINANDIRRLNSHDSLLVQESLLVQNLKSGFVRNDTNEIISNLSRMGSINQLNSNTGRALEAYNNAYRYSRGNPAQATNLNQKITDIYLEKKDFGAAIDAKQELLNESFVQNSTQLQAKEINALAGIYLLKKEESTAEQLLLESYRLSVQNGHTLEARRALEQLDSLYRNSGRKEQSLQLYAGFLQHLPGIIEKDSSIADNRLIAETEIRIRELETEKALKDDLIRRKNIFNYWLIGSVSVLAVLVAAILIILRQLRIRNKKIALQSLRREMNPHFIFNSLNSVNQFIATNNELEANRYLTRFSTLMRRVMENSKDDFILLSDELELLQAYLELEKSRFPDQFDFTFSIQEELSSGEQYHIPGMLIQPHLENAIWHGLRYRESGGHLQVIFNREGNGIRVLIEDNGIGIAGSKAVKTVNQQERKGRGIPNTQERIRILNDIYHKNITCEITDIPAPGTGVRVSLRLPLIQNNRS
ncbi:MAG: histidine kinase [Chitinophagales bacterium]|nr:histidine kinase [Chitinophagales bacterium]